MINRIILEKSVFQLGETVNVIIEHPNPINAGDILFFEVRNGGINGELIFFTTQELQDTKTTLTFGLPPEEKEYDRYLLVAHAQSTDNKISWIAPTWLYTKEGAQNMSITNLQIDKNEARPGDVVNISFQVKDGAGNLFPWVEAQIGLCKGTPEMQWRQVLTPYIIKKLEELERKQPGSYQYYCTINYPYIYTTTDAFDIKFRIHDTVPVGDYKLVIFAARYGPYYDEFVIKESRDIKIKGEPIVSDKPDTFVHIDQQYSWNQNNYAHVLLTSGQSITFLPRQVSEGEYGLDPSQEVVTSGIIAHVYVVDPYGHIVFNNQTSVNENGNFDTMKFTLTNELQNGVYEIYHNITKDGNYLFWGGMNVIEKVSDQKFNVKAEGKTFDVYFQSLDLEASNLVFDQEQKSMSFDIKKLKGKFHNQHLDDQYLNAGNAMVVMDKPLLSGPYVVELNGKPIFITWYPSNWDLQYNIEQIGLRHINEDGTLTITATHVVPEFPFVLPIFLISFVSLIVFYRLKFRVN